MDALLKEAEAISLPCFDLVPAEKGDPISAYWGGRRADLPEKFPPFVKALKSQTHLLSIDQELFQKIGIQGRGAFALSIVTTTEGKERPEAVNVENGPVSKIAFENSIPLTAKPMISLPPFEALLLYGGAAVTQWLSSQGLQRWQYEDADPKVRNSYLDFLNPRHPLTSNDPPFARIGGWHVSWPDDDFYMPREMRLMIWTFHDSEPWYEVFLSPLRNYKIKQRIT